MTAFARTEFFSTNTKLEQHLVHAIRAYRGTTGNKTYAERSEIDAQPYCFYQIANVAAGQSDSSRFLIARLAVPLSDTGDITAQSIWTQAIDIQSPLTLPAGFRATS